MVIWVVGAGLALLAVAAAMSIGWDRDEAVQVVAGDRWSPGYEDYAAAAQRLREVLGREPSARELLEAVYTEKEPDEEEWVDLRREVAELIASWAGTG